MSTLIARNRAYTRGGAIVAAIVAANVAIKQVFVAATIAPTVAATIAPWPCIRPIIVQLLTVVSFSLSH